MRVWTYFSCVTDCGELDKANFDSVANFTTGKTTYQTQRTATCVDGYVIKNEQNDVQTKVLTCDMNGHWTTFDGCKPRGNHIKMEASVLLWL